MNVIKPRKFVQIKKAANLQSKKDVVAQMKQFMDQPLVTVRHNSEFQQKLNLLQKSITMRLNEDKADDEFVDDLLSQYQQLKRDLLNLDDESDNEDSYRDSGPQSSSNEEEMRASAMKNVDTRIMSVPMQHMFIPKGIIQISKKQE